MHDGDVDPAAFVTADDGDALVGPPVDHRFRCPGCDEEVDVPAESVGRLVRCPYCNSDFFAAHGRTHDAVVDDTHAPADDGPPPDELNAARVRNLSALRLATLRTRSWCLIGLLLAAMTAADLFAKAVVYVWDLHRWGVRPTLFVLAGLAAAALATRAVRAARQLGRDAARSAAADPATPPDFSTLGNGADRWRHLEEIR